MRLIIDIDQDIYKKLVSYAGDSEGIVDIVNCHDKEWELKDILFKTLKAVVYSEGIPLNSTQVKRLSTAYKKMFIDMSVAFQQVSSEYIEEVGEICDTPFKDRKCAIEKIFDLSRDRGSITYKTVNSSTIGRAIRKAGGSVSKSDIEAIFEYLAQEGFGEWDTKYFRAHKNKSLPKNLGKANPEDLPEIALLEM